VDCKKIIYLKIGGSCVIKPSIFSRTMDLSLSGILCPSSKEIEEMYIYINKVLKGNGASITGFHIPGSTGDQFLETKFLKWILATCLTAISQFPSTMICNNLTKCCGVY
jgi:hypothetical protein